MASAASRTLPSPPIATINGASPAATTLASVARIVGSEPASITGTRPVRPRTAAETADTTRSRRAGSIIPEALGLTRTSGSPAAIGVGVTGRCYALP